jgi:hypothetical protein
MIVAWLFAETWPAYRSAEPPSLSPRSMAFIVVAIITHAVKSGG